MEKENIFFYYQLIRLGQIAVVTPSLTHIPVRVV